MADRQTAFSGSPFETKYGFSRALRLGERVFIAGTAPIWPDGSCNPDPAAQARRCWEIVEAALEEVGSSLAEVVRTRMFITDASVQDAVGAVHGEIFGEVRPVSTMVVVAGLLDPRWVIEVEADTAR